MQKIKELRFKEVRQLINKSASMFKDKTAYYEKVNGNIVGHSFEDIKNDVSALGNDLLKRGFKNKHIAIIGENSYTWIVSYLAVVGAVGVAVPLDKELYEEQIADLICKGDVSAVIFSDTFFDDMEYIKEHCEKVKDFICMSSNDNGYITVGKMIYEGRCLMENGYDEFESTEVNPNEMKVIMFTSGTTGANKGVMISQTNLLANTEVAVNLFKEYKTQITVLPFHHAYENVCGIYTSIASGRTTFINDSLKYLTENMKRFKPEIASMVPVFLETINKSIEVKIQQKRLGKLVKLATRWSDFLFKIGIDIRKVMFMEINKSLGGNFRTIVCGGAALKPELVAKFRQWGIKVINGFGISECTPLVAVNTKGIDDKCVGQIVDICDVKIDEPNEDGIGEILVKGINVMLGYYNDEESTKASFIDGWFRTGDYGYMIGDSLYITGRKKNLIVLGNGKNVSPEELEGYIYKEIPYVEEAIVYAGINKMGGDVILAAVYLDDSYISKNNINNVSVRIKKDIKKLNRKLPGYKQIQNVFIREEEFEKNSSKKIMRYKFLEGAGNVGMQNY